MRERERQKSGGHIYKIDNTQFGIHNRIKLQINTRIHKKQTHPRQHKSALTRPPDHPEPPRGRARSPIQVRELRLGFDAQRMEQLLSKIKSNQLSSRRTRAAVLIQKNWKAYLARRQLFKQYDELIKDKHKNNEPKIEIRKANLKVQEMPVVPKVVVVTLKAKEKVRVQPSPPDSQQLRREITSMRLLLDQFKSQIRDLRLQKEKEQRTSEAPPKERKKPPAMSAKQLREMLDMSDWNKKLEEINRRKQKEKLKCLKIQELYYLVQVRLDERATLLSGPGPVPPPAQGFDTSVSAVESLLSSLTQFIQSSPAVLARVIRSLNRPHGIEPRLRLVILHGYNQQVDQLVQRIEESMLVQVLDQDLLAQFLQHYQLPTLSSSEQYECFVAHFKAVVNSFNESLGEFRPYAKQQSPPYPWSCCPPPRPVTGNDFLGVLRKAAQLTLRQCRFLGGLHLSEHFAGELVNPQSAGFLEELVGKKRKTREQLLVADYVEGLEQKFYYHEDERTDALMDLADELFDDLARQLVSQTLRMRKLRELRF